jgi:hypothetical protein
VVEAAGKRKAERAGHGQNVGRGRLR